MRAGAARSKALADLLVRLTEELAPGETEFRFAAPRLWRFDVAWPAEKLAVEIDGGAFSLGRHTRGVGFLADAEKLNTATMLGWRVLRFTPQQVASLEAMPWVLAALGQGTFEVPAKRRSAP